MAQPIRPTVHIPRRPGAPEFKLWAQFDGPLEYVLKLYEAAQGLGFSAELSASTSDGRASVEISVADAESWHLDDALKRFQDFNDLATAEYPNQE